MSYTYHQRLTALDDTFLELESPHVHMHVGAVHVFDGGPLRRPDGGLDFPRILGASEPALRQSARFRQRIARVPLFGNPVWVDDPTFRLDYHVRHTSLPAPGDVRQLKRLAGRIFSEKLDLSRPLWEMWLVEGLDDGRFAAITKVHHCMIDGVSGADLLAGFVRAPAPGAAEGPGRWVPRPAPSPFALLADEITHRASLPLDLARAGAALLREPRRVLGDAFSGASAVGRALTAGLGSASPTPFNDAVGPHRRFDWARTDLAAMKELGARFGGATVNDVALAVVSGAVRRLLERRGVEVDALDFRAMLPVSVRRQHQQGKLGNRVAFLMARLPVDEPRRAARVARVVATTRALKSGPVVEGTELLEELSDRSVTTLVAEIARLAARTRSYNMVVTNVPGPPSHVNFLGARMEEVYPLVPLFSNQAVGVALFSYAGRVHWGFNADWDLVPDLHDLVGFVLEELEALGKDEGRSAA